MRGGGGGANFGGFRGRFIGAVNLNAKIGATRTEFTGFGFPRVAVLPAGAVGFPFTNVSFPLGLGVPANGLSVSNRFVFLNNRVFSGVNNRFVLGRGLNSGFWGGWGFGISDLGLPFSGSSYWPRSDYDSYPPPALALMYAPQPAVRPLSEERARPVMHEYDQSGQEIRTAAASSAQAFLGERGRPVIHEYDPSGHEILPAGPLYLIAFADHTIHTAISYRVDGNTLNYATPEREQKAVPLNTVDRALSVELNRERQVPFVLP